MSDERYDFERWAYKKAASSNYRYMDQVLKRLVDSDDYATTWVDVAWMAWQARSDEAAKQQADMHAALVLCVEALTWNTGGEPMGTLEVQALEAAKAALEKVEG